MRESLVISKKFLESFTLGCVSLLSLLSFEIDWLFFQLLEIGFILNSLLFIGLIQRHGVLQRLPVRKHLSQLGLILHLKIGLLVSLRLQQPLPHFLEILPFFSSGELFVDLVSLLCWLRLHIIYNGVVLPPNVKGWMNQLLSINYWSQRSKACIANISYKLILVSK